MSERTAPHGSLGSPLGYWPGESGAFVALESPDTYMLNTGNQTAWIEPTQLTFSLRWGHDPDSSRQLAFRQARSERQPAGAA